MSSQSPVAGQWYSSAGSPLTLHVDGTKLSGTFDSTQDQPETERNNVSGSVAECESNPNFLPLAFTVAWPPGKDYGPSVTSYTGQYTNIDGHEQIEVIFLLSNQTKSSVLWKSTQIAWDVFTRQKS